MLIKPQQQTSDIPMQYKEISNLVGSSVNWLTNSDIRIKNGENKGSLYGWKDLSPPRYPFIYSEITGYAITFFCWIHNESKEPRILLLSQEAASWINNNLHSNLMVAGKLVKINPTFGMKGNLEDLIYSFDNGIIIAGLANLYSISSDPKVLNTARNMADNLIKKFFDGNKMNPLLDRSFMISNYGKGKWSTQSGPYHSKIAFGLLKLYRILGDTIYRKVTESICDYVLTFQQPDGRFTTNNERPTVTYLHPHLYACEGLLYAGLLLRNIEYISSCIKGIDWATKLIDSVGILPRSTEETNIVQTDCVAQLLRLLLICYLHKKKYLEGHMIERMIDLLQSFLCNFYILQGQDKGAVLYNNLSPHSACTWSTMFAAQALSFWLKSRLDDKLSDDIMDYFI